MQLINALASNDEVGLIVYEKNLSIEKAINGTHLIKLDKAIGEINTLVAVTYLINRFASSFNVGKTITESQSVQLAADIVEKYPYETIEDVVLMFKQVRQGIIGDGKDFKLDGQNVLSKWFPNYLDVKYAEVERLQKIAQFEVVKEINSEEHPVTKFYTERIKKLAYEAKVKQMENEIDEMVKFMDRQMLEDTILDWEKKQELLPYLDYLKRKRTTIKK